MKLKSNEFTLLISNKKFSFFIRFAEFDFLISYPCVDSVNIFLFHTATDVCESQFILYDKIWTNFICSNDYSRRSFYLLK